MTLSLIPRPAVQMHVVLWLPEFPHAVSEDDMAPVAWVPTFVGLCASELVAGRSATWVWFL